MNATKLASREARIGWRTIAANARQNELRVTEGTVHRITGTRLYVSRDAGRLVVWEEMGDRLFRQYPLPNGHERPTVHRMAGTNLCIVRSAGGRLSVWIDRDGRLWKLRELTEERA